MKISRRLDAIELDRDLIDELESRAELGGLIVHEADALNFDFASLQVGKIPLRVFGNLPYNISTPLLFHLLTFAPIIKDMVFMLQKEVAERLAAPADSDDYGRLSVRVQYHCQVDLLFNVPKGAFHPPPKVESSIVRLTPHQTYPYVCRRLWFVCLYREACLRQRRKTLRNSLRDIVDAESGNVCRCAQICAQKIYQ